ncbi:non-ribosomal peptide synthetase, partial [Bradyrhizobium sp. OK095]|uniref:non-ribosomal peptide synthetase n=1 Tax=Bradyrhizobium sp. OK095 TaxID=1882760 RepID=UPI0008B0649C
EDISGFADDELLAHLRRRAKEPFVLERGPLLRVHLLNREDKTIILIVVHHIAFDAGSLVPFLRQLVQTYEALLRNGRAPSTEEPAASYADFVGWERQMLSGPAAAEHLAYWKQHLASAPAVLTLPSDHPRRMASAAIGQTHTRRIGGALKEGLAALARELRITPATLFLGLYQLLLSRYAGEEDIVVGMSVATRPRPEFRDLIGYFINMVPVRMRVDRGRPWSEHAAALQGCMADCLDHSVYPFPMLVRELKTPRVPGVAPIFQVAFTYQNNFDVAGFGELVRSHGETLQLEPVPGLNQEGEYELALDVFEGDGGFQLHLKYNPDLFDAATIERMMGHYVSLAEAVVERPSAALGDYALLTEAEQGQLVRAWNATQADYPDRVCVHELFAGQARRTPDAVAVRCGETSLSYRELDRRSSVLAGYLRQRGVGPDRLVGICVGRSLEMLVGLLAILKAGGAYVPLDPSHPRERLQHILSDSGVSLLLTQSELLGELGLWVAAETAIVAIDLDWSGGETAPADVQAEVGAGNASPDDLAYVMYTSGSTGLPKGVMIPHRALTNLLTSMIREPGLRSEDRLLAVTTYCFDIAGFELFGPLLVGGCCEICPSDVAGDVEKLKRVIRASKPTVMQATPATWTMLFRSGWRNEEGVRIVCGGEALGETLRQSFVASGSEAWNMYGPTETTIWSMAWRVSGNGPISIGRPIANTQVYVLDSHLRPVPVGVAGELCIGGAGVARGYHNRPELTEERFVEDPFTPGARLYRTGDMARWLVIGEVEYLGRLDGQIKLRGYRIEPGEIEARLASYGGIRHCAVVLQASEERSRLIAFYVWDTGHGQAPAADQLREHLKVTLPDYMIPAFFSPLDEIPLTPNGKVDHKGLAQLRVGQERKAPASRRSASEIERRVVAIWRSVLDREDVDADDGFFESGGDSILAVTLAARIRDGFAVDFDVTRLFEYASIGAIGRYVAAATADAGASRETEQQADAVMHLRNETRVEHGSVAGHPDYYRSSVAIIGISCHVPGAENHRQFWDNLISGKEGVEVLTAAELRQLGVPEQIMDNPRYVPVRSTIAGKDLFDPAFFKISPKDAALMDPQLRLLLQHAWWSIEDAGYVPSDLPDTGVFASTSNSFYGARLFASANKAGVLDNYDHYQAWLLSQSGTVPTTISYRLGLRGPSYAVHSNCSSSLIALHTAYRSILLGDARHALVAAAALGAGSSAGYVYQEGLNFASDGHVKTFDAKADGMIGGEGVAVLLLKRAEDAVADGDHIYALIRGVAVNNDGTGKAGFYAPSVQGQAEVIGRAFAASSVDPQTIGYVEAHGTGTSLGDPIEFAALSQAFRKHTDKAQFCGLGSVKSNIGHLDVAAGLAGTIKAALALQHGKIPPTINYHDASPHLDLINSPFYIAATATDFAPSDQPRRAAVSSFGIGGTNTHAILEQAPELPQSPAAAATNGPYLVPLSARTEEQLKQYAASLLAFVSSALETGNSPDLADLAFTMQVGREAMES